MTGRTGWRLTLEPVGDDVAYSLLRDDGSRTDPVIECGLLSSLQELQSAARDLTPPGDLWSSPLCDSLDESSLATTFGMALLPAVLRRHLLAGMPTQQTLTIAARGWLATLAWNAMALTEDASVRLIERARVIGGLNPALVTNRARTAGPGRGAGVCLVDPGPLTGRLPPLWPEEQPPVLRHAIGAERAAPEGIPVSRQGLSRLLDNEELSRFVFVGHVRSAQRGNPASAALVLGSAGGQDLLTAADWLAEPQRWPVPERAALIGCASDDTASDEQSGLVVAAMNAGARLVTSTRWFLPTDRTPEETALSDLVAAAIDAHRRTDPLESLRAWSTVRLGRWRSTAHPGDSPLLWGGLVTYLPS